MTKTKNVNYDEDDDDDDDCGNDDVDNDDDDNGNDVLLPLTRPNEKLFTSNGRHYSVGDTNSKLRPTTSLLERARR